MVDERTRPLERNHPIVGRVQIAVIRTGLGNDVLLAHDPSSADDDVFAPNIRSVCEA